MGEKKKLLLVVILLALGLCGCREEGIQIIESQSNMEVRLEENVSEYKKQCVYICGAINNPGVYEIGGNTRLEEIIEKAGGFDEEADRDAVNLAMYLSDEEQIRIPYIGEDMITSKENLININTAGIEELCEIPGIGESRAKSIIEYREKAGGFKSEEELMEISGIKEATYNKIKSYICIK